MANTAELLESLWARINNAIGDRIKQTTALVSQAFTARDEAQTARLGAEQAAGNASGSVRQAQQYADSISPETLASYVETSSSEAARSKQEADRATSEADHAEQSFSNAESKAQEAATSATAAAGSETRAGTHSTTAKTEADRAEFAATETIQQVSGNFATRNYVDSTKWAKSLLYTTHLDEVLTPGVHSQPNGSWATIANGYPEATRGTLTVTQWDTADAGRVHQVFVATFFNRVWMRERINGVWAPWQNLLDSAFQVKTDLTFLDLDTITAPGIYRQPLAARATAARNYPQATRGILTVHQWGDESQVSQTYQATFRGDVYTREHSATGWEPWMKIAGQNTATETTGHVNRRDAMKQESQLRRGGVIGTNGATPVSLSFDHGYVNFRDKVLPHLKRLGLPCTSAFNQGQLGSGENAGISWAELQEYGLNHGVEYAHHAYSHTDIDDASTNVERITNALTSSIDLAKTNMPEVVADVFILPGVGGTNYDGFNGGVPAENWWDHSAGEVLMQHFPVVSAKRRGYTVPAMQSQDLSFGSDRYGWDTNQGADDIKTHINSLRGTGLGVKIFMHPSQIGAAGKISESKLIETLEWLATERDAGRIEVLTVSGFAYANTDTARRLDLAPENQWAGDRKTVDINPLFDWVRGAQVILESTANRAGELVMSATSDEGGLATSVTHDAVAGRKYRLVFSIPVSASNITLTADGSERSLKIV